MTELKTRLENFNRKRDQTEEIINNFGDRTYEFCQLEEQNEKIIKKIEAGLWQLYDTIKKTNFCIIEILKDKWEKYLKRIFFKIVAEKFPNLEKDSTIQE